MEEERGANNKRRKLQDTISSSTSSLGDSFGEEFPPTPLRTLFHSTAEDSLDRNWFQDYEDVLNLPAELRGEALKTLVNDFEKCAWEICKIIIEERYITPAKRRFQKSSSGVAGGAKYQHRNIFFKFSSDTAGLYGGDEYAMKSSAHELRGLNAYFSIGCIIGVNCQLMSVIDYMGFRVSAFSWLPIVSSTHPNTTLRYGSDDGGRRVWNEDPELARRMEHIGKVLGLKAHRAGYARDAHGKFFYPDDVGQEIYGPGDIEVHLIGQRYYILDTARVFPPTPPLADKPTSFLYRQFRPEFMKQYPIPLSSDAFSGMGGHNAAEHEREIFVAEATLLNNIKLHGEELSALGTRSIFKYSSYEAYEEDIHHRGINLRYTRILWEHITEDSRKYRSFLLEIMVARTIKDIVREEMRKSLQRYTNDGIRGSLTDSADVDCADRVQTVARVALCKKLSSLFGHSSSAGVKDSWENLQTLVNLKFEPVHGASNGNTLSKKLSFSSADGLKNNLIKINRDLFDGDTCVKICKYVGDMVHFKCAEAMWDKIRNVQPLSEDSAKDPLGMFDLDDIIEIGYKSRSVYAVQRIQADSLVLMARNADCNITQKKQLYESAISLYRSSLHDKPDDEDGLLNLGNCYGDLAELDMKEGNYDSQRSNIEKSVEMFTKSEKLRSNNPQLYKSWGNLLRLQAEWLIERSSCCHDKSETDNLLLQAKEALKQSLSQFQRLDGISTQDGEVKRECIAVLLDLVGVLSTLEQERELQVTLCNAEKYSQEALDMDMNDASNIQYRAAVLIEKSHRMGGQERIDELQKAVSQLKRLEAQSQGSGSLNLASIYALLKDYDECSKYLKIAKKAGYLDSHAIAADKDFAFVRNLPWFQEICDNGICE